MANSARYQTPDHEDWTHLEKKYWSNITLNPAIYGADNSGSITDPDQPYWNIARLGTILDEVCSSLLGSATVHINMPPHPTVHAAPVPAGGECEVDHHRNRFALPSRSAPE